MAAPKSFFFCRLVAPRPTFAADMTESERRVMQVHGIYWKQLCERGLAVIYGPVMDPKEAFGLGILEADDEAAVRALLAEDPAVTAGIGLRFEIHPMRVGGIRKG
jgi:uncharacterized protein YciI